MKPNYLVLKILIFVCHIDLSMKKMLNLLLLGNSPKITVLIYRTLIMLIFLLLLISFSSWDYALGCAICFESKILAYFNFNEGTWNVIRLWAVKIYLIKISCEHVYYYWCFSSFYYYNLSFRLMYIMCFNYQMVFN